MSDAPTFRDIRPELPPLSPRHRSTLERLLAGMSEKQIATDVGISRHTVHTYVKEIYVRYAVNSRSELMALWIRGVTSAAAKRPTRRACGSKA